MALTINWANILRRNEIAEAKYSNGLGITHTWKDGSWDEDIPEVLAEWEVIDVEG